MEDDGGTSQDRHLSQGTRPLGATPQIPQMAPIISDVTEVAVSSPPQRRSRSQRTGEVSMEPTRPLYCSVHTNVTLPLFSSRCSPVILIKEEPLTPDSQVTPDPRPHSLPRNVEGSLSPTTFIDSILQENDPQCASGQG
ncbi:unnamed protein product [Ranitomeya imitator]|uniref:Vertebrate heat shock transcription factor C-terminal domain-containing protein n=1 Tax=Ranitomeya imitator TaxID=111125 RepID=A0ABN9LEM0_9NEOB|nr:unnamed protein product [Ranitomeya imitator]